MKLIEINNVNQEKIDDISCMLGNFDGLHKGHTALINSLLAMPNKKAIITLAPHPRSYFDKDNFRYIMSYDQKMEALNEKDIDYCIRLDFETFKDLSVEEFVIFLRNIGVKDITCGQDYRFSKNRQGTPSDLSKHFETIIIEEVTYNNKKISSSYIRELITDGNLQEANKLLGFIYKITGIVVKGRQIGRTIGFPTANIEYTNYVLPKKGVYYGQIIYNNKSYKAMINIGNNPTMNKVDHLSLEVHILDFDEDIYGKTITVEFIDRLRDEIKFSNVNLLLEQLNKDRDIIINKPNIHKAIIDRPIGYKDDFGNVYPINYGYIPGIIAGDGEEQDVYILGIENPIDEYEGAIIAKIFRTDDNEDKWVMADKSYSETEIWEKVKFIEKYFDSKIVLV